MSEQLPIKFSDAAAARVKQLIEEEENPSLMLRVYVTGGGCSGFQYGFTFAEQANPGDMQIEKNGVTLVVDPMSIQYLVDGEVDYTEGLEGSRFFVNNPNATTTCGCGASLRLSFRLNQKLKKMPHSRHFLWLNVILAEYW